MSYPTIISYYTDDWEYPKYAKKMKEDCVRLGLKRYIVKKDSAGGWIANTRMKSTFIYETMMRLREPVLWIDVDGSLLKVPELLYGCYPYDFAARPKPSFAMRKWHVGTMYFNYTSASLWFLSEWCKMKAEEDESDEVLLDKLWKSNEAVRTGLRVAELPKTYFQMLNGTEPEPLRHTVIAHRASTGESKREYMQKHKVT